MKTVDAAETEFGQMAKRVNDALASISDAIASDESGQNGNEESTTIKLATSAKPSLYCPKIYRLTEWNNSWPVS